MTRLDAGIGIDEEEDFAAGDACAGIAHGGNLPAIHRTIRAPNCCAITAVASVEPSSTTISSYISLAAWRRVGWHAEFPAVRVLRYARDDERQFRCFDACPASGGGIFLASQIVKA
jgi:hypothetical protein